MCSSDKSYAAWRIVLKRQNITPKDVIFVATVSCYWKLVATLVYSVIGWDARSLFLAQLFLSWRCWPMIIRATLLKWYQLPWSNNVPMPTLAQYNLHLQFVWEIIIYNIVNNSIYINDSIITWKQPISWFILVFMFLNWLLILSIEHLNILVPLYKTLVNFQNWNVTPSQTREKKIWSLDWEINFLETSCSHPRGGP